MAPSERRAYALSRKRFERGNVDEAIGQLAEFLRRARTSPTSTTCWACCSSAEEATPPAAARSLREALRIDPGDQGPWPWPTCRTEGEQRSRGDRRTARTLASPSDGTLDATTRGKLANLQAAMGDTYAEAGPARGHRAPARPSMRCPPPRHPLPAASPCGGGPVQPALAELGRVCKTNPDCADAAVQRSVDPLHAGLDGRRHSGVGGRAREAATRRARRCTSSYRGRRETSANPNSLSHAEGFRE